MTNKALIITILVIVVVAAGGVYLYNWNLQRQNAKGLEYQNNQQTLDSNQTQTQSQATTTASSTADSSQVCQKDFNENTLKTAQVNTANRQVQISVKGYGNIVVSLYDKDAPKTVENFLRLTNAGYYDCLTFHRVAQGFVIQGGDPNGNGSGGTSAFGTPFADELNPNTASYKTGYVKGVLAMANSGPNTNGSQFFIMLADHTDLPHNYTIFGKVVSGQDVVDKIGQVTITPVMGPTDGSPAQPVVMQKVSIVK